MAGWAWGPDSILPKGSAVEAGETFLPSASVGAWEERPRRADEVCPSETEGSEQPEDVLKHSKVILPIYESEILDHQVKNPDYLP